MITRMDVMVLALIAAAAMIFAAGATLGLLRGAAIERLGLEIDGYEGLPRVPLAIEAAPADRSSQARRDADDFDTWLRAITETTDETIARLTAPVRLVQLGSQREPTATRDAHVKGMQT